MSSAGGPGSALPLQLSHSGLAARTSFHPSPAGEERQDQRVTALCTHSEAPLSCSKFSATAVLACFHCIFARVESALDFGWGALVALRLATRGSTIPHAPCESHSNRPQRRRILQSSSARGQFCSVCSRGVHVQFRLLHPAHCTRVACADIFVNCCWLLQTLETTAESWTPGTRGLLNMAISPPSQDVLELCKQRNDLSASNNSSIAVNWPPFHLSHRTDQAISSNETF